MKKRDDLHLIVSSATLDAEVYTHSHTYCPYFLFLHVVLLQLFKNFFETNTTQDPSKDTAIILTVEGRAFDVKSHYVKRCYWTRLVDPG